MSCNHKNLQLVAEPKKRLRCRHCHLTITENELGNKFCPECYEQHGKKRYDFDDVKDKKTKLTQYKCEQCYAIIQC